MALLVRIKSITDLSVPLANVCSAGGPGCIPFNTNHSHCSHIFISHGALALVILSILLLVITSSPNYGASSPMRVFQSPHITVLPFDGMSLSMSST